MTDRQRLRRIAELTVKVDDDVKWDIENQERNEIWIQAFIEGACYIRDIYDKALGNESGRVEVIQ